MAEEYSDASLLLPGSDPLLRTEPVDGGLVGARAGSTLGGLLSPTLARFLLPKRRSIRPRGLRPRPTGGWLTRSAGLRLRVHNAMRLTAFPETDFSLRAYHRRSKRIGARLKRYVHVWLGMAFWRVRFKNTVSYRMARYFVSVFFLLRG